MITAIALSIAVGIVAAAMEHGKVAVAALSVAIVLLSVGYLP